MWQSIRETFFNTSGRINRLRYLKRNLVVYAVLGVWLLFLWKVSGLQQPVAIGLMLVSIFIGSLSLYILAAQRLRDIGYPGLWAVGLFVISATGSQLHVNSLNLVALGAFIYLYFKKGQKGANQYGPDPLAAEPEAVEPAAKA